MDSRIREQTLKAMGACEVCGQQATNLVRDFAEIIDADKYVAEFVPQPYWHRFCEAHTRESKRITLDEAALWKSRKSAPYRGNPF